MSRTAVERFNERKTRLINLQNHASENIYDELVEMDITVKMTEEEWSTLCKLLDEMQYWSNWCNENVDIAGQSDLNKWATRLKNFIIYMLEMANKYKAFNNTENPKYDSERKMIVAGGDDIYFLG